MCYKICTKLLMKKKIIIKTHLKSWSIFRDFFSALWCCLQGTDQQYVATLQWHRFTNFNTCSSEWGGVCFPPSTTGRVIGAVPVILCLVSGFHSTPSIESQEQQLHHYTPNKGGTKPFKYNHTIPRLHQKTTTTLWSIKNARLQVPYKVIQAQEFVNFVLPWNFVWRQQKIYRQESVLTNPIFYVYYFKNNMRSQPSHSLPSAGLNLRHRFQTAGLGLGSNRSCSLWSYAWSLDFSCFKIDNRGREGGKYSSIILFTTVNSAFDIDNLILSMFDIIRGTMYMKKKQMRGRIHPLLLYFECCEIQTPCIKSQEQHLLHYTPNKGGTKPFKYIHTIPSLQPRHNCKSMKLKSAGLQVPCKVIQAQEFVNFILPGTFVWRQQKL